MTGVVTGGWGFVWSAYAITLLVLGGYAVSVLQRYLTQAVKRNHR